MSVRKRTWLTKTGGKKSVWIADCVDSRGKRYMRTFSNKEDASIYAAGVRLEPIIEKAGDNFLRQINPHGCICPPTSEQTCMSPLCPRRPIRG
jgi:hypothetical protein